MVLVTHFLAARQRRRATEPLARLLLDAIDDRARGTVPASAYPGISPEVLDAAVFIHKVAPAVYIHLKHADDVPAELLAPMRARYEQQIARQLQVGADLAGLARTFEDAGLAWAAFKGPILAEHLWSRPDLRVYIDLDVLVDPRHFGAAMEALTAAGAQIVDRNWELINEQVRGEISLTLPHGTALDLHWHVVNSAPLRREFRFSTGDMLARTRQVTIAGVSVPTLDPTDTLLHLAYHTAHSGGHRLMWLKDVERATADRDLDWKEVLHRAHVCGVGLPLAVVLTRVGRVLGFDQPPPSAATRQARRSTWGAIAAATELLSPAPTLPGDRLSGQIAYKNARSSSAASMLAAARSLKTRGAPPAPSADNPLYAESGGAAARAAYLRAVESAVGV